MHLKLMFMEHFNDMSPVLEELDLVSVFEANLLKLLKAIQCGSSKVSNI